MAGKEPFVNAHGAMRLDSHPRLVESLGELELRFTFDGATHTARNGETVLAALLAEGVRVVRTMPNSGENRGGYCLVGTCSDCLMIIDGEPNVCSCQILVQDGMIVETQLGLGTWSSAHS